MLFFVLLMWGDRQKKAMGKVILKLVHKSTTYSVGKIRKKYAR